MIGGALFETVGLASNNAEPYSDLHTLIGGTPAIERSGQAFHRASRGAAKYTPAPSWCALGLLVVGYFDLTHSRNRRAACGIN
jgi:hypothetical protein